MTWGTDTATAFPSTSSFTAASSDVNVLRQPLALVTLMSRLRDTWSSSVVEEIQDQLFLLGQSSPETAAALLRSARSGNESGRVRSVLLEVAAALDLDAARSVLLEALLDSEPRVRSVAVQALADIVSDDDVRRALERVANDDPSDLNKAAAREALAE